MADTTPPVTLVFVEWLERLFPVKLAGPNDLPSQIMYDMGAASVARKVRAEYNHQQKG